MNKSMANFIDIVYDHIVKEGGKLKLENKPSLKAYGGRCSGYYDPDKKVISVACDRPTSMWFEVLVHEYAHFLQHKLQTEAWVLYDKYASKAKAVNIDEWLKNKNYNPLPKKLDEAFRLTIELEREAELLSLKLIDKYKLPLNKESYSKRANCYLTFYFWVRAHRLWYKTPPYNLKNLQKIMPSRIMSYNKMQSTFNKFDFSRCFTKRKVSK